MILVNFVARSGSVAVPLDSAVPSALDTEEVVDRVPVTIMMSLVVVPVV